MQRASSEVEAANGALSHVGQAPIASLDERRAAATVSRQRFPDVRDALLRRRYWNFASAWTVPAASSVKAIGKFSTRYPMPNDCLAIRAIDGLGADEWAVEGSAVGPADTAAETMVLVTNIAAPRVNYTRRIENPALWDSLFLQVFQLELGSQLARIIAKNAGLAADLHGQAEVALREATLKDTQEKARTEITRETSWVAARRGYRSWRR